MVMGVTYNPKIATDGLVLCLDAANKRSYPGTGTVWSDLSGNGNHGYLINGPTFSDENTGGVVFDGANDYIRILHSSSIAPTSAITYAAWARSSNWTGITSQRNIISKTQNGGYQITVDHAWHTEKVGSLINIGGTYRTVSYPLTSLTNGWHNFLCTFDGRYLHLYVDGVKVDTYDNTTTSSVYYASSNVLMIGAEPGGTFYPDGNYWNDRISSAFVYSRALTADEVRQNFEATKGRYE